jgi:hypothetical protein
MPLLPFGEWRPDISDYEGTTTKNIQNVLPRGDGYGPFPDFAILSQALPAACRGAFYALKSDGSVAIFAGTLNRLYLADNTDYSWDDVSLGASAYSDLSSDAQWQFAQFGSLVFATQKNAVLQVFDLSAPAAFANCAGSPPQAAYISVVGRFLVLSGLSSNPYRIHWSGLNATTTWTSGTNSSDFQDFPDGGIVRGVAGGEFGIVFQDQAIRRMSYIPGSPLIFQIDRISQDKGLFAPYSIIRAGELVFFHSAHGFHKIAPGGVPEQIGRERVDRYFFDDLDKAQLRMFIGASDPRSSRAFWAYKSTEGTSALYDKIIGFDYVLDRWFTIEMTGEYLLGLSQPGITLENLDSISASIDALGASLDSFAVSSQPLIAQFGTSHNLGFFSDENLEATLETSEQGTDGQRIRVQGFNPIVDSATVYGSASTRETQQATATAGVEILVNSRTGRCDLNTSTRYSRFKVRIPASTAWTFAAGVEPLVRPEGKQ